LNEYARLRLSAEDLQPVLEFDGELTMEQVTPRFWESLRDLQPFGMGNPEPVFMARGATVIGEPKVLREKHLKLKLRRYQSSQPGALARGLDALGWRMAHRLEAEPIAGGDALDVLFRIEQNTHPEFGGGLQLVLSDYRQSEAAVANSVASCKA
jgi:single-stranded-DNA-specific exonuclease